MCLDHIAGIITNANHSILRPAREMKLGWTAMACASGAINSAAMCARFMRLRRIRRAPHFLPHQGNKPVHYPPSIRRNFLLIFQRRHRHEITRRGRKGQSQYFGGFCRPPSRTAALSSSANLPLPSITRSSQPMRTLKRAMLHLAPSVRFHSESRFTVPNGLRMGVK